MARLPLVPVDLVEGLDVIGFAIARLALLVVGLRVRLGVGCQRHRGGGRGETRARADRAQELAAADRRLAWLFHDPSSLNPLRAPHDGSAKASVSISMNTRPNAPTW